MTQKELEFLPCFAHQKSIQEYCQTLRLIGDIKYIVAYLIFNNGTQFILSNAPTTLVYKYWCENYRIYDHTSQLCRSMKKDHYFASDHLSVDPLLKKLIETQYSMHLTYTVIRRAPECTFAFHALHDTRVQYADWVYKNTLHDFEDFCIAFLDQYINVIKTYNPAFKRAIILNDAHYRRATIKQTYGQHAKLTGREMDCLLWAALGKSSEETAIILNSAKQTIDSHRKHIKYKLNCTNMTQAVCEAIKQGYLGAFQTEGKGEGTEE